MLGIEAPYWVPLGVGLNWLVYFKLKMVDHSLQHDDHRYDHKILHSILTPHVMPKIVSKQNLFFSIF
jgi:hypothetical protein